MNRDEIIKSGMRDLRVGTFLAFISINLRFVSGNVLNAFIFFNILQPDNPGHKYDIHAPSIPDMYCDAVMVAVLAFAYLFITSNSVKSMGRGVLESMQDVSNKTVSFDKQLKDYITKSRGVFSATVTGIGMYLFSKYVLTIKLEVSFVKNMTGVLFVLDMLNNILRLCYPIINVYAYCKYLSTNKHILLMLCLFFTIRNLFAANMFGLIPDNDLHVGAPFLDILSPIVIIYAAVYFIFNFKTILYREQRLLDALKQNIKR